MARRSKRRVVKTDKTARMVALLGDSPQIQAADIYRVSLPFTYLNRNSNISAGWIPSDKAIEMVMCEDPRQLRKNVYDLFAYDIVVLRRWLSDNPQAGVNVAVDAKKFSEELTGREALLVYESDDDYSGRYRPADIAAGDWKPFLAHVDAVVASVKPLADLMSEEGNGVPSFVAPNAIPRDAFMQTSLSAKREDSGKIVVMLAGTATHHRDWMPVAEVMPDILKKYPNVAFKVAGNVPDYLYGKCEFLEPVPYKVYPALLRQADILCCSLDPEDQFNLSKSPIKVIEGWSAARPLSNTRQGGCAIVASKAEPYKGVVTHRNNGLLIEHSPGAWKESIEMLIEDWHLRQKIQINGLKRSKGYDIALRWRDWHEVFSNILALRG